MARCGCASNCSCAVTGGCGIQVVGSGGAGTPYMASAIIDPDEDNILTCGPDGLKVLASAESGGLVFGDTDCIEISGSGTGPSPIVATPVLDDDPLNLLACGLGGMLVKGDVLAWAVMTDSGGIPTTLPAAAEGVSSNVECNYNTSLVAENITTVPLGGSLGHTYIEVADGYDGIYYIEAARAGWVAGPAAAGDTIFRLSIVVNEVVVASQAVPVFTSAAEAYNIPELQVSSMRPLTAEDQVWIQATVESYDGSFAGATLAGGKYGYATQFFNMFRIGGAGS